MAVFVTSIEHVSPCCCKFVFDGAMRNNVQLKKKTNYTIPGFTIKGVVVPAAQAQPYDAGDPNDNGGMPEAVYIATTEPITGAGPIAADFTAAGLVAIVDYTGVAVGGLSPVTNPVLTPIAQQDITYWTDNGLRTSETFKELKQMGRARWNNTTEQPMNYSTAQMIGKINDLMSGALTSYLGGDIVGPTEPEYIATLTPGGVSSPVTPPAGIGDTITFKDGAIPFHVDKLWGVSDGSNKTFRTSIMYHPFACVVIVAEGETESLDAGIVDDDRWFSPNSGYDRQLRLQKAPPQGATVLAVYVPRASLVKIGEEILAYEESDIVAGTAIIYGRAQLKSSYVLHEDGDFIEDVWGASFIERAQYNMFTFGASGQALEYLARDYACPRSDNPRLNDTQLRRMIFHTSCSLRGTPGTVTEALRYIHADIWPFIIVDEDPRWPGCIVIWYSTDTVIGDLSWITSPPVEPWETWLDHLSWLDGMPLDLMSETYLRDDAVDAGNYGDYLLPDWTEDPVIWPFPVVISGPAVSSLGTPAPYVPPPLVKEPC